MTAKTGARLTREGIARPHNESLLPWKTISRQARRDHATTSWHLSWPSGGSASCRAGNEKGPGANDRVKSPRNAGGHLSASLDVDQIDRWWTQWPDALVGIDLATSGLFAIDADRHGGPDGVAAWEEIAGLWGDVGPSTFPYVRTPAGGLHIYLRRPEGMQPSNRTGGLPAGIDVRGAGYTIAPGCVMPDGRAYEPVDGSPALSLDIPYAPDWLVELIGASSGTRVDHAREPVVPWDGEVEIALAMAALDAHGGSVEGAGGDKAMYELILHLRGLAISSEPALEMLSGDWNEKCAPPWSMEEIDAKIAHVYRSADGAPGARVSRHEFAAVVVLPPPALPIAKGGGFPLLNIAELLSLPPVEWLVEGMILKHGLAALYGAPGSMKSFIGIDLALRLAFGFDWHGVAAKKVGVLYVAAEGAAGLRNRVKGWLGNHGKEEADAPFMLLPVTVRMLEGPEMAKLITAIDEAATRCGFEIGLVVIDTVARAMAGADENAQSDMSKFVAAMDGLREHTGGAVLGIHHSGKDLARGMRGSSVLNAAVDTSIRVEIKGKAAIVTVEKQKDATFGDAVYLVASTVEWQEEGGETQSTLVLTKGSRTDAQERALDTAQTDKAFQAIEAAWNSDKPFSAEPRSKGRFLPVWLSSQFGLDRQCAQATMQTWLSNGLINQEEHSRKNHRNGLRVY